MNTNVCQKEIMSSDKGGDWVKYRIVHIQSCIRFGGIFYNQEIIKMDNLNGDRKCCFSENIGTSTYCIAGIRWELDGYIFWMMAEANGCMRACELSWQPFIWLGLCHYQNNGILQFWLNESFPTYNCRMMINVCITFALGIYLCIINQYLYLLIPPSFCL